MHTKIVVVPYLKPVAAPHGLNSMVTDDLPMSHPLKDNRMLSMKGWMLMRVLILFLRTFVELFVGEADK